MIEILNLRIVNNGSVIANFDCRMHKWGGPLIRGCTLFGKGAAQWVTLPSISYVKDDKTVYKEMICFEDKELNNAWKDKIRHAVVEEMQKSGKA